MVREEQLSLCFEPHANEGSVISSERGLSASAPEQRPLAKVLQFKPVKQEGSAGVDVDNARLLEKITRKVKYF
ncbi:hypothetical protein LFL96_27560 [Paraburkholderia sp. D15]|uniref:hypothetical protein n=1 Tax=Paraburkholderia sp. D15 TaxID=2880218 RepID=UPI00247A9745|nr:hypothetical protein [Paraburkholderia sp. D15]WGS51967.1 hypothetical protein LFL96_27560 [Paraburkholderia sp. D15]WKF59771.1 hypothetical protein HUO10_004282 [Paraburkholderia busanensis]